MRPVILAMTLLISATFAHAQADDPKLFAQFNRAELVARGRLTEVKVLAVGLSDPPLYSMEVRIAEAQSLRGPVPANLVLRYSSRKKVVEPIGSEVLLAVARTEGANYALQAVAPATKENVELAKKATSVPLGWTFAEGAVVSPWAGQAPARVEWNLAAPPGTAVCGKTKRPALLAGKNIELSFEQVPPKKLEKFKNPFGDGEFKVTVTNRNDAEVEVPALLRTEEGIAWSDSLVFIVQDKTLVLPGPAKAKPHQAVKLKPNETVSTTVNSLHLKGIAWPRGGSRVYLQVALGELSRTNFFYYFSAHHDKLLPK